MSEIKCPYDWFCGSKYKLDRLSQNDQELIHSAVEKNMKIVFVSCPECQTLFEYDTKENISKGTIPNPHRKNVEQSIIIDLENERYRKLPGFYQKKLEKSLNEQFDKESSIVDKSYKLFSINELFKKIPIDGRIYLQLESIEGYVKMLEEVLSTKELEANSPKISYQKLSKFVVIGEKEIGILLLDSRDSKSIWVYNRDDGSTFKFKLELNDLLNE